MTPQNISPETDATSPSALPRPALAAARESVFAAYTAAHGHPLEHDGLVSRHRRTRRWVMSARAASIVVTVALALFLGYQLFTYRDVTTPLTSPTQAQDHGEEATADGPAGTDSSGQAAAPPTTVSATAPDEAPTTEIVVHVAGEVKKPGLYTLPAQSRVADAIDAAGGVTKKADTEAHNLARTLVDGEQILVPRPGETVPQVAAESTSGNSPGTSTDHGPTALININTASAQELQELPGIGPALAERIVAHRDTHGLFATPEALDDVSGIGPTILANLTPLITT